MTYVNLNGLSIKAESINDFTTEAKRKLSTIDNAIDEIASLRSEGLIDCQRRLLNTREKLLLDIKHLEQLAQVLEETKAMMSLNENVVSEYATQSGNRFNNTGIGRLVNVFAESNVRTVPIIW